MRIFDLQRGDSFVDVPEPEYARLSRQQRSKLRVQSTDGTRGPVIELCRAMPGNVHVRLAGAHWCTHADHQVTRVERKAATVQEKVSA